MVKNRVRKEGRKEGRKEDVDGFEVCRWEGFFLDKDEEEGEVR